jgi:hypothetical protein
MKYMDLKKLEQLVIVKVVLEFSLSCNPHYTSEMQMT